MPVEADGSVYCVAPVGKEIYFQLLDDKGVAVRSMRSGTYVHPGEKLQCASCHEGRGRMPQPETTTLARSRQPSILKPELQGMTGLEPVETVNYYRLAKPVLDAQCASCHQEKQHGPDMSYASLANYLSGYEGHWDTLNQARVGGSRTLAGHCGIVLHRCTLTAT